MDQVKDLLLNPNHEMPSGAVVVAIIAISLLASFFANYLKNKRK